MNTAIQSCAQCRTVLLPGESRCLVCGTDSMDLTQPCPVCGHGADLGAHFCTQCGHAFRQPAPVEPEPVTEAEFVKVRNPGARFYTVAGATAAVLLALLSVHSFVGATFFTPQRAVTGFFDALAARDATAALSFLAPVQGDGVLLTDAVLGHEGYRPPLNITVGAVAADGDRRVVPVGFELDGQSYRLEVVARRSASKTLGVFRRWVVEGGLLPLTVAAPGGVRPVVNGVAVSGSAAGPLAVFPGGYRVGIAENPLLQMRDTTVSVTGQGGGEVRLSPALRESVRSEVEAEVKSYVDSCARSTAPKPDRCPFAVTAPAGVGVRWSIASYPTLALSVDPGAGVVLVSSGSEGWANATGTSSDGTPFSRFDRFRISGTAALVDGKVRFTAR